MCASLGGGSEDEGTAAGSLASKKAFADILEKGNIEVGAKGTRQTHQTRTLLVARLSAAL